MPPATTTRRPGGGGIRSHAPVHPGRGVREGRGRTRAAAGAVYGARAPEPVIASRTAPPERVAQAPVDGDAAATHHLRSARRTALIVLIAASAVALTAAASLLFVALTP